MDKLQDDSAPKYEWEYYDKISRFLEKRGYICRRPGGEKFIGGKIEKMELDVYGISDVGDSHFEDIEIVGVEVKKKKINLNSIRQAIFYQKFCHRIYLASPEASPKDREGDLKSYGIGFLKIDEEEITERIPAKMQTPSPEKVEAFLTDLCWLRNCSICHLHYFKEDDKYSKSYSAFEHINFAKNKKDFYICDRCMQTLESQLENWTFKEEP